MDGLLDATQDLVQGREKLEAAKVVVDGNPSDAAAVKALGKAFAELVNAEVNMARFETDRDEAGKSYKEKAQGLLAGGDEVFQASQVKRLTPN